MKTEKTIKSAYILSYSGSLPREYYMRVTYSDSDREETTGINTNAAHIAEHYINYLEDSDKTLILEDLDQTIKSVCILFVAEKYPPEYHIRITYSDGAETTKNTNAEHIAEHYIDYMSDRDRKEVLKVLDANKPQEPAVTPQRKIDVSHNSNISMQILSGFMITLGTAAVAIAFTLLNAASFGLSGLLTVGIGAAVTLSGIGLFAVNKVHLCESKPLADSLSLSTN
jgi:hypothetical protein